MNINHTRNFYPSLIFPPKAPVDVTTWTDILGVIWRSVSQGSELSANKEPGEVVGGKGTDDGAVLINRFLPLIGRVKTVITP